MHLASGCKRPSNPCTVPCPACQSPVAPKRPRHWREHVHPPANSDVIPSEPGPECTSTTSRRLHRRYAMRCLEGTQKQDNAFLSVLPCGWVCSSRLPLAVLFSPAVGSALLIGKLGSAQQQPAFERQISTPVVHARCAPHVHFKCSKSSSLARGASTCTSRPKGPYLHVHPATRRKHLQVLRTKFLTRLAEKPGLGTTWSPQNTFFTWIQTPSEVAALSKENHQIDFPTPSPYALQGLPLLLQARWE